MHFHKKILCAIASVVVLSLAGCHHKDLYTLANSPPAVLEVRFDWAKAPEARPEGMTVCFFSLDNQGMNWRFDIPGADGGTVEIPYGHYSMIAYNNDVGNIRYAGFNHLSTYSLVLASVAGNCNPIDTLYSGMVENISFGQRRLSLGSGNRTSIITDNSEVPAIVCYPAKISTTYTVEFRNISGADRIQSAAITMSDVSQALLLETVEPTGNALSVSAALTKSGDSLLGIFESFRPYAPQQSDATIQLRVTTRQQRIFIKNFDISQQIANQTDPLNVHILIENLQIPDDSDVNWPGAPGAGTDGDAGIIVDVDGWSEIIIDYNTAFK